MDTEIKNTVRAADVDVQDEFKGLNPKEVVTYIEGERKLVSFR